MQNDQLALPFLPLTQPTFMNFAGSENEELIAHLSMLSHGFSATWIHGASGAGKTHLLLAAVHAQRGLGFRCAHVDARQVSIIKDQKRLLAQEYVAVDNLSAWLGSRPSEEALFSLYQNFIQRGCRLLLSDDVAPLQRNFLLPDLASRMRAAQVFEVWALDEAGIRQLLQRRARDRGLTISRQVLDYWLARRNRSLAALFNDLDSLDAAIWKSRRRLTVPYLKSVLTN
jgi:DnaA family protein